jgi:outer membrane protein OmpA-like peptidoglycan-associated protein
MIPGGSVAHGNIIVAYGSGDPIGTVPLLLVPQADDYVPEPALVNIRMAAMENPKINVPSDILFDFDSFEIRSDANSALLYLADLLNNRKKLPVSIEGHTDSIGPAAHNLDLSRRRAEAVKGWFVAHHVYRSNEFKILPFGETQPIASERKPDGSDDPEARQRNRRVVVNGAWNI